jgi:hypothetical protein
MLCGNSRGKVKGVTGAPDLRTCSITCPGDTWALSHVRLITPRGTNQQKDEREMDDSQMKRIWN